MSREQQIKRRVWQLAITFAAILLVLTWAEVTGRLSIQAMAFAVASLAIGGWVLLTISFRKIARQYPSTNMTSADAHNPATRKKIMRSLRISQGGLILMPVLLIDGLLNARDAPWVSTAVGVTANLGMTWLFLKACQAQKAKLQEVDLLITASNGNTRQ